jgi:hypothetical protein
MSALWHCFTPLDKNYQAHYVCLLTIYAMTAIGCSMDTGRNKKMVTFAVEPKLLDRIEAWRIGQDVPPSKTAAFEVALREFLEKRNG